MIVNAAVTNIYEYKTSHESRRDWYIRRFLDCIWYLRELQDAHMYASFASGFLAHASCKLDLLVRLPQEQQNCEYGVWEHTHSPVRFLQARPCKELNISVSTTNPFHSPCHSVASWSSASPRYVQQSNGSLQNGHGWYEPSMPRSYCTSGELPPDASDTIYPNTLFDRWMAEYFLPFMNE